MIQRLCLAASLIFLISCDFKEEKTDDKTIYQMGDANLVITSDKLSPAYNRLFYVNHASPHGQVYRDFVVQAAQDQMYTIAEHDFDSNQCKGQNADYQWFLVHEGASREIAANAAFRVTDGDRVRAVVNNDGSCEQLELLFLITAAPL